MLCSFCLIIVLATCLSSAVKNKQTFLSQPKKSGFSGHLVLKDQNFLRDEIELGKSARTAFFLRFFNGHLCCKKACM